MGYDNLGSGKHRYSANSGTTTHEAVARQLGGLGYKPAGETPGIAGATKTM